MIEAYQLFWKNFFKIKGRSRRREFWWPLLINTILTSIISGIVYGITRIMPHSDVIYNIVMVIINIAILIGTFTVTVRRFHDIGKTMILPCIFFVISLYAMYIDYMNDNGNIFSPFEIQNHALNMIVSMITLILAFLEIVFSIITLIYCVRNSQKDSNQYGPNPKQNDN